MASETSQDPALSTALNKRRELQETIRDAIKQLDDVETFLRMYRKYSIEPAKGGESGEIDDSEPTLGRVGSGFTQAVFESLVREVLRERGEPLQSNEMLEEFHKRGQQLGGTNEIKQMWNRLWQAKSKGVLVHYPKPGYWLADEPIPESASVRAQSEKDAERMARGEPRRKFTKKPPGRKRVLWTDEQIALAKRMAKDGKSVRDICAALGGISVASFYLRFKGGIAALANDEEQPPERDLLS